MCKHVCGGSMCVWINLAFKYRWQIALYYESFRIIDCTSHRKEYDHADMINDLLPSAIMMYSLDVWSFKCSHISLYICLQLVKLLEILKNFRISMNLESSVASLKSMIMSAETHNSQDWCWLCEHLMHWSLLLITRTKKKVPCFDRVDSTIIK